MPSRKIEIKVFIRASNSVVPVTPNYPAYYIQLQFRRLPDTLLQILWLGDNDYILLCLNLSNVRKVLSRKRNKI